MFNKSKDLSDNINQHVFSTRIEAEKILLVVLSDIHSGANDREYFKETIDFIMSIPNCYVIIGGDIADLILPGSKGIVLDEQVVGEDQIYSLVEDLKPLVNDNRILAIGEMGNHSSRVMESAYISPNRMLAVLLGIPKLYTGDMCLGFINVKDICYTISVIHKHKRTKNYYEFARVDLIYKEHIHELSYEQKLVYEWNKYTKSVTVVPTYEINNGSFLNLAGYAKRANYRPQWIGTYFTVLDGKKRHIQPFIDTDLKYAIDSGMSII
jgi:hypothetical protein